MKMMTVAAFSACLAFAACAENASPASAQGRANGMVPLVVMSSPEDAKGAWVNDFRKRGRCSLRRDAERGCLVLSFTNLYCHLVIPEFTRRLKECAAALDPKTFYVKYRASEYEATTELKFESHGVYHVPILPVAPGPDLSLAVARANLAWSSNGSAFSATNVTVSFIAPSGSGILEIYEMGILKEVRRPPAAPRDPTPVAADAFAVFPEPREWKLSEEAFLLPKRCPWRAADLPAVARDEFRKDMADFHGVELVDEKGDGAAIVFALSNDLGPVVHDGFTIRADAGGIAVRALEPAGLAFAAHTLADLIWRAGGERIPAFELRDWPRKRLRPWQDATMGCGHDQKYAVPFYTEMLRRFPLGARYNRIGHYMDTTFQWRASAMPRQGNAWTAADYAEIVDYVNGHGVRMMPTIQSLGHMDFFIALPKGNAARFCEDGKPGVLCTRNPESTALLMDMYDELIALCSRNPGLEPDYFYTMHDEVRWLTYAVPEQNRCRRCAGVPKNRLFLESVLRCRAEIARRGMTMVMATDMITDSHNGRNRFNCAAIKDEIPKDVVLSSWSALDDIEIDSFAKKGYRNWKLYTGLHANPEGDENVEAIGFGIFSFNWWLSRVRSVDPVSYGILAGYLQAYFAWREAPTGEKDERLVLARKYGDFLMRSWSRKPLPRKTGERPLAIDPPPRPGKVASLVFTHGAELAPADRAAFLSRTNTHDALKGPVIAIWRARYSDGKVAEIPIQYGWNVGDVESDGHRLTEVLRRYLADCRRVIPDETDTHVRFEYEWANPRPDTEIVALELEEKSTLCRYRLFAFSAGMLKPARSGSTASGMESVRAKIGADAPGARWVNIGSNSGLFAFDWESAHVNGLNLARSPQSERGGAKMVKARRNAIAAGAYVIIPICPFSSILPESYDRRRGAESHPLISFDGMPDERAMSAFADKLDKGWKREFSIRDYSDPMTATNRQCYFACVAHMRDFIGWCRQEGLKPVLVLPPAAKCLRDLFPDSFMKDYVYDFVRDAIRGTDVQFIDYWNHRDFQDPRLFATALFLNKMGRRRFTARVMADCLNGKGDTREMQK